MWRFVKLTLDRNRGPSFNKLLWKRYASSQPSSGSGAKTTVVTLLTVCGVGTGVVAYGKYDPKFRKVVEDNVPYSDVLFKLIPDFGSVKEKSTKDIVSQSSKEPTVEGSLLRKKQERLKKEAPVTETSKSVVASKPQEIEKSDHQLQNIVPVIRDTKTSKLLNVDQEQNPEKTIKKMIEIIDQNTNSVLELRQNAAISIEEVAKKLYEALDAPSGPVEEQKWQDIKSAQSHIKASLKSADSAVLPIKDTIKELESEIKIARQTNALSKNFISNAEETIKKAQENLKYSEKVVSSAQNSAKTASEYNELVKKAREQFQNELKIVLPKFVNKSKDKSLTEDEFNLLITHAHRRIESLQKELARQQVTEKQRTEEALHIQKFHEEKSIDSQIATEILKHEKKIRAEFNDHLDVVKNKFEMDMRQQLCRQAAAHADHLQEALLIQRQELDRKFNLDVEEKMLHQKGIFISEISESLSRLKGIEAYLQANIESQESSRKVQALWLACQSMKDVLKKKDSNKPNPLAKELALLKNAAGDENAFVSTIVAGIPSEAIQRGVYTDECLKQRFENVKRICKRVAMINDNNRSLFRYFVSYLQSLFIIDSAFIPQAELQGKVAVDPSEWDTFDILNRITFCLQKNDLLQALRYANQLKGEPRSVARDWILEVRLLLETTQAVDCLITYAASIGIQIYH